MTATREAPTRRGRIAATATAALLACTALVAMAPLPAAAAGTTSPVAEWLSHRVYDRYGTPGGGIDQALSTPVIGDVNGDGVPDVVAGGMDGRLSIRRLTDGLNEGDLDTGGPGSMIQASPTLVDVTGDGVLDVLVATVGPNKATSRVVIYSFAPSSRIVFYVNQLDLASPTAGFISTPVVGDITGDGVPEVVDIGLDQYLYAWRLDGSNVPGFPRYSFDTSLSTPTLADLDGDGVKDILVGFDMDSYDGAPYPWGGLLLGVKGDGSVLPGYPRHLGREVIWSSPVVTDLNGDGRADIVVGTGTNFHNGDSHYVHALDAGSLQELPGWPVNLAGETFASPVILDAYGDGQKEVAMRDTTGTLALIGANGQVRWAACTFNFSTCGTEHAFIPGTSSADINGDGVQDLLIAGEREVRINNARTGALEWRLPLMSTAQEFAHPAAGSVTAYRYAGKVWLTTQVVLETNPASPFRGVGDEQAIYVWSIGDNGGTDGWPTFGRTVGHAATDNAALLAPDRKFVQAAYRDLLGRAADPGGETYWASQLSAGRLDRVGFAGLLARSPEWTGRVVDGLYLQVLGRPPDPGGRAYWANRIATGTRVAFVAGLMYGSNEYFAGAGGTIGAYVDKLYQAILRRAADSAGRSYWVGRLSAGYPREQLATDFFLTIESNARRVDALYATLLGRATDPGGRDFWAHVLVSTDDVQLAALLVGSPEYFARAQG